MYLLRYFLLASFVKDPVKTPFFFENNSFYWILTKYNITRIVLLRLKDVTDL